MSFSSDTETEDEQHSEPKEDLRMRIKMLEEELSEQRTLVSQLQKANLALQTSKLINFNYNKYK